MREINEGGFTRPFDASSSFTGESRTDETKQKDAGSFGDAVGYHKKSTIGAGCCRVKGRDSNSGTFDELCVLPVQGIYLPTEGESSNEELHKRDKYSSRKGRWMTMHI